MLHPMLNAVDLTCQKGSTVLFKNLNFYIDLGEALHVQGKNGSGKTSLLKIISGLSQPSSGYVYWQNEKISESESFKSDLCFVGHKQGLKQNLTVQENLKFIASMRGNSPVNFAQILSTLELQHLLSHQVNELSAGQKQRLSLARLLIVNAKLWLLDEPLTALDQKAGLLVKKLMEDHLSKNGMIVFTSHQELKMTNLNIRILQLNVLDE